MNLFQEIESFITSSVWPFLKNVGKTVVKAETAALQPIAEKLVADAAGAMVAAAQSGSTAQIGAVLGKLIADAGVAAEAATISAGATALAAAVGTALASNPTTAINLAPAAPSQP